MVHYQFKQYKYDYDSKSKIPPLDGQRPSGTIVYLVTHRRIARQITTSYKVFPREWDEKCSEPIAAGNDRRAAIVQSITRKLRSDMERLSAIIERFENLSRNYSSDDVVEKFRRTGKREHPFCFYGGCHRTVTAVESLRYRQEL